MVKGCHFDKFVILLCVRWYLAYNLSLRNLKEMMAECGVHLDHSTVHRWVLYFSPKLLERFNRKKRQVTNLDETYIKFKFKGEWLYLYRAIDSNGDTVEFCFSQHRDLTAAKRFLRKALARHGRPVRITIDGSETNRIAILQCDTENRLSQTGKPIAIRSSKYMNNMIEQDHRRIERRTRSMLGFKSETAAGITLAGIELIPMSQNFSPAHLTATSSKYHPGTRLTPPQIACDLGGRTKRSTNEPSQETSIPRSSSIPSTSRRLRLNRR